MFGPEDNAGKVKKAVFTGNIVSASAENMPAVLKLMSDSTFQAEAMDAKTGEVFISQGRYEVEKRSIILKPDEKGYLKEAVLNYIALLGWNPRSEQEIFNLEELVKEFDYRNINKSPAIFDNVKLKWMNGEYIKKLSLEEFNSLALPYYKKVISKNLDFLKISSLLQTRVEVLSEIPDFLDFFEELPEYTEDIYVHKRMKSNLESSLTVLEKILPKFKELSPWTFENIEKCCMGLISEMNVKNGVVLWPVRIGLSGKKSTPGGAFEIADIIGKEESIRRTEIGIEKLKKAQ